MPVVTVTGNVRDHGLVVLPQQYQQRLWFKPNRGRIAEYVTVADDARVYAELEPNGDFSVQLLSVPNDPGLWYTLCTDWLPPGQESEPTEERARTYYEWPERIYPDIGGRIGDLVGAIEGVGLVYVSDQVRAGMQPTPRQQLAYNPDTCDLYEREISW